MKSKILRAIGGIGLAGCLSLAGRSVAAGPSARPNILIIVADDLGYSDIGAFGGEIQTPNLDLLAARGERFTSFYTAPACSPTRAMLLTGVDHHEAGMGTMAEMLPNAPELSGRDGYEGHINARVATLAERLSASGYSTLMAGKWHLGYAKGQTPATRGFSHSYALLPGAHNHFGMDQGEAYKHVGSQSIYEEDGVRVLYPEGAYSSDYFATKLIEQLSAQRAQQRPFFAYLAFTAPHWPLQAPDDVIAKYKGRYDAGPLALRTERLARLKSLGLIAPDVTPHEVDAPEWRTLSPQRRAEAARKMEVYAAMVDRLDQNIGRVLAALRAQGRLDDTLIFFMSDNGPEGLRFDRAVNVINPAMTVPVPIDNDVANMGRASSTIAYGPDWARASSAPYWGVKAQTSEGGIHSPLVVAGPGVGAGRIENALVHVTDIAPTVLEAAGAPRGDVIDGQQRLPIEGRSFVPVLTGKAQSVRGERDTLGWELFYRAAVRRGGMKAVYQPSRFAQLNDGKMDLSPQWQLYDLSADPGETRDLARTQPSVLKSMIADWNAYAAKNKIALLPSELMNPKK